MSSKVVSVEEAPALRFRVPSAGTPGSFKDSYMLAYDFDNTCYKTIGSDAPDVEDAYLFAVGAVLGAPAQNQYVRHGGLKNRAPSEIVAESINTDPQTLGHALEQAEIQLEADSTIHYHRQAVAEFVARRQVTADQLAIQAVTELVVLRKKEVLFAQINPDWPKPINGFDEHWAGLYSRRNAGGDWDTIHTAVVSSGHSDFIGRVLQANGLPEPDLYVTDDEMRRQPQPRVKPHPLLLRLVRNTWFSEYRVIKKAEDQAFLNNSKKRQVYIGDDLAKDGQMAASDGITFIHHDGSDGAWTRIDQKIISVIEKGGDFARQ